MIRVEAPPCKTWLGGKLEGPRAGSWSFAMAEIGPAPAAIPSPPPPLLLAILFLARRARRTFSIPLIEHHSKLFYFIISNVNLQVPQSL